MRLKGVLSDKNIAVHIAVWLGLVFVMTVPTMLIWYSIAGSNPSVAALKTLQAAQTFVVFILPMLLATWLCVDDPWKRLCLDRGIGWQTAGLVVLLTIVFSPGINLLSKLNEQVVLPDFLSGLEAELKLREEQAAALTDLLAQADSLPGLLVNLCIMAVLPALGEELCFRGGCQGMFPEGHASPYMNTRLRPRTHAAVWVTAILFSALHFQFYGFVPRMLLGALLGYLLCFTGSLYAPMLAHFTNNAVAVGCFYMEGKGMVAGETLENLGSGETWWIGVISLLTGGALLWLFVRRQSSVPRP